MPLGMPLRPQMQVSQSRVPSRQPSVAPMPGPRPGMQNGYSTRNYASGGYYPTQPMPPNYGPAMDAAAAAQQAAAQAQQDYYGQQMDLLQQLQGAQNTGQIGDLLTQITLAQSQGNANQTWQSVAEQQAAQQLWQQQVGYLHQQGDYIKQGLNLDYQQIENDRVKQLQAAGLSKQQAEAIFRAEYATGQLAYSTGMETAAQQHKYGLGQATQSRNVSQRRLMSDATARGATSAYGTRADWADINKSFDIEKQNLDKTREIRQTYESQTWINLQNKINEGRALTDQEYNMLVEQANKEAGLENQMAYLQMQQSISGLNNQLSQGSIQHNIQQQQFLYQQQQIANADKIRDLQWQLQMAQLNNPGAALQIQMQMNQLMQQMAMSPLQGLGGMLGGIAQGLPMPMWSPNPIYSSPQTGYRPSGGPGYSHAV